MDQSFRDNPDVGYMITKISYGIRQYFGNLFAQFDVTYPQSRVLTRLFSKRDKEDVNQRDLEHALGIKASSVSSLVRNLEQKGLIYCERLPKDTRNKRILLTEKGLQLQEMLENARLQAEQDLIRELSDEQLRNLREGLGQLMANLGIETDAEIE